MSLSISLANSTSIPKWYTRKKFTEKNITETIESMEYKMNPGGMKNRAEILHDFLL